MILGYNTNGLAHHEPEQALDLLAEIGYRSVALTIDHQWLSPYSSDLQFQLSRIARQVERLRLACTLETGARFLLDSRRKHWPSLVLSREDATPRLRLIRHAMEIAGALGAKVISIWSGALPGGWEVQTALDNLAENLETILIDAESFNLDIGFEPEPGMFIDSMVKFDRLLQWVRHPRLKLTLDIGHLFCQGEVPLADYIERWAPMVCNLHIEDMRAGVHEHLMFGEGDIHFPPVIAALHRAQYAGPVHIELSRHSHDAANISRRAFEFLNPLINP